MHGSTPRHSLNKSDLDFWSYNLQIFYGNRSKWNLYDDDDVKDDDENSKLVQFWSNKLNILQCDRSKWYLQDDDENENDDDDKNDENPRWP